MEHGTVEMYRKHLREKTEPCQRCRAAQARAIAKQRQGKPRDRSTDTQTATIKRRALNRLAQEHPDRLAALIAEERARV
jgi:hypothetical protein